MPARLARNRRAAVPFRLVLLGPLVVMMLASGGLAALASFLNERAAVRSVLEALRKDRMERVNDRLRSFLGTPLQILQLNAATLGGGVVDVSDRAALTGLFLHEARSFATVTSVYFGSAGGGLADAGREGAGTSFYLIGTDGLARGALTKREVRDDRAPGKVLARVASFDASTRPWYAAAAQSAGAVWTGPYILATGQDMTLTASRTVRSPDGRLLGVAAVDVFISQLGSFLQSADNGGGTLSFIMDRQGLLIAQSDGGTPYQPRKGRVPAQRLLASASANPLVREAFAALSAGPEGLRGIRSERLRDGRLGGLRHFMDIAPFGPPDFDWLIVTVIPASRYLDRIQAGNRETAAVLAALLCGLVAAALLAARQITRPISRLTDVAKFLARIQRAPLPVDGGWIRETRDLASAFNVMQNQVLGAIDVLDRARSDVEERNVTLQDLNQKLRALVEGAKRLVTLEAEEALGRDLLTVFSRTVGASGGSFYLAERNALRRVSALDPGHAPASIPLPLRPDCILNAVVKAGRPVVWDDLGRHHRQVGSGWTGYRNGSALVVPLIDEQQGLIGLVSLHDKQTPPFTSTDLDLASVLSSLGLEAIRTIRANAALREREEMYREVFEKTSDGLFVVEVTPELRFRLLSINPAEERMLGISGEEVAGRFHEEFLPPGLLSVARRQNLQAIQARRPMTFQSEIDLPAGRRFFHTTVAPIQDAEGRVHRIIGVARDMTESRRFEEALRRSEEKFSHAFHGNPDGAAITRMEDGVFLEVNPAFTLIFGYGRDEVIERSSLEDGLDLWVNPGDRARLVARLQEHGEVASECVRQRRKDGQIRDILLSWKVIEVEGQARILATARDITEQRRMEAALKDSEARFRLLAENATDLISRHTPDGTFLYASPACAVLLGYDPSELVGLRARDLVNPEDQEKVSRSLSNLVNGTPRTATYRIRRRDGTYTWFETASRAIRGPDGELQELHCVSRDISERVSAQERTRRQEQELFQAAKLSSLGTMLSGIAHEINNPNNFIRLSSQNLAAFWGDLRAALDAHVPADAPLAVQGIPYHAAREMVGDLLKGIDEGSQRIERLLVSLRDFVRGDEGALNERVPLNAVVRSAVMIVQNLLHKSTDAFSVSEAPDLAVVTGNYHQLEQVVINLLTNACQALESREQGIRVQTRRGDTEEEVVVTVADDGVGIPAHHLPRVADPFFTTRTSRGGTGLGLSVSSRIVQMHGGTISFCSKPGGGTTVTVRLPAERRG